VPLFLLPAGKLFKSVKLTGVDAAVRAICGLHALEAPAAAAWYAGRRFGRIAQECLVGHLGEWAAGRAVTAGLTFTWANTTTSEQFPSWYS
jgi:hypothetical protein